MGPFTNTNRFRLPTVRSLRNFAPGDLVMQLDGKSAYKQRPFAWIHQNRIGFQTKINNQICYLAALTLPFGLHNAGYFYQKTLERKLQRICANLFFLEYIDDVAIRIGRKDDRQDVLQWRSAALLHLITLTGEIFNDKFEIFTDRITLLGVNYFPKTDRFTPKLSTFFKLHIKVVELLRNPTYTPKRLESLISSFLWILPKENRHLLQPLQFTQKQNCAGNKRDLYQNKPIPINTALLDGIFNLVIHCTRQYLMTDVMNLSFRGQPLYIVVDSNPFIAGGYIVLGTKTLRFLPYQSLY